MGSLIKQSLKILGETASNVGKDFISEPLSLINEANDIRIDVMKTGKTSLDTLKKFNISRTFKGIHDWFYSSANEYDSGDSEDDFHAGFDTGVEEESNASATLDTSAMRKISDRQTHAMFEIGAKQAETIIATTAEVVTAVNNRSAEIVTSINNMNTTLIGISKRLDLLTSAYAAQQEEETKRASLYDRNGNISLKNTFKMMKDNNPLSMVGILANGFAGTIKEGPAALLTSVVQDFLFDKKIGVLGDQSINQIKKRLNEGFKDTVQRGLNDLVDSDMFKRFFGDFRSAEKYRNWKSEVKNGYNGQAAAFDGYVRTTIITTIPEYLKKIAYNTDKRSKKQGGPQEWNIDDHGHLTTKPQNQKWEKLSLDNFTSSLNRETRTELFENRTNKNISKYHMSMLEKCLTGFFVQYLNKIGKNSLTQSMLEELPEYVITSTANAMAQGTGITNVDWAAEVMNTLLTIANGSNAAKFCRNVTVRYQRDQKLRESFVESGSPFAEQAGRVTDDSVLNTIVGQMQKEQRVSDKYENLDQIRDVIDQLEKTKGFKNKLESISRLKDLKKQEEDLLREINDIMGSGDPYDQHSYGTYLNMSQRGCGPVALADSLRRKGMYDPNRGMYVNDFINASSQMGYPLRAGKVDNNSLSNASYNNPITLIGSGASFRTRNGNNHFVNVIGDNHDGTVSVMNPIDGKTRRTSKANISGDAVAGLYGDGDVYEALKDAGSTIGTSIKERMSNKAASNTSFIDRSLQKSVGKAEKFGYTNKNVSDEDRNQMQLVLSMMQTGIGDGDIASDKAAIMSEISKIKNQQLRSRLKSAVSGMIDRAKVKQEKGGLLKTLLSGGKGILKNLFTPLLTGITSVAGRLITGISKIIKPVLSFFKKQFRYNMNLIKFGAKNVVQGAKETFKGIGQLAGWAKENVLPVIGGFLDGVKKALPKFAETIKGIVALHLVNLCSAVKKFAVGAVDATKKAVTNLAKKVSSFAKTAKWLAIGVFDATKEAVTNMAKKVSSIAKSIVKKFPILEKIGQVFIGAADMLKTSVQRSIKNIVGATKYIKNEATKRLKSLAEKAGKAFSTITSVVGELAKSGIKKVAYGIGVAIGYVKSVGQMAIDGIKETAVGKAIGKGIDSLRNKFSEATMGEGGVRGAIAGAANKFKNSKFAQNFTQSFRQAREATNAYEEQRRISNMSEEARQANGIREILEGKNENSILNKILHAVEKFKEQEEGEDVQSNESTDGTTTINQPSSTQTQTPTDIGTEGTTTIDTTTSSATAESGGAVGTSFSLQSTDAASVTTEMADVSTTASPTLMDASGGIASTATSATTSAAGGLKGILTNIGGGITKMLGGVAGILAGIGKQIFEIVLGMEGTKKLLGIVKEILTGALEPINQILLTLYDTLKPIIDLVKNTLADLIGTILSPIASILKAISPAIELLVKGVNKIINFGFKFIKPPIDLLCKIITGIGTLVTKLVKKVAHPIKSAIQSVANKFGFGKVEDADDDDKKKSKEAEKKAKQTKAVINKLQKERHQIATSENNNLKHNTDGEQIANASRIESTVKTGSTTSIAARIGGPYGLTASAIIGYFRKRHEVEDTYQKKLVEDNEALRQIQKVTYNEGVLKVRTSVDTVEKNTGTLKGLVTTVYGNAQQAAGGIIGAIGKVITAIGHAISIIPGVDSDNPIAKLGEHTMGYADQLIEDGSKNASEGLRTVKDDKINISNSFGGLLKSETKIQIDTVKKPVENKGVEDSTPRAYATPTAAPIVDNSNIDVIAAGDPYDQHSYGTYLNMSQRGCGPVALADAYTRRTGRRMNVNSLASSMMNNGSYSPSLGTSVGSYINTARSLGMNTQVGGVTTQSLQRASYNNPITLVGDGGEFSTRKGNNHFMNVIGTDRHGGAYVMNPINGQVQRRSASSLASSAKLGIYAGGDTDVTDLPSFSDTLKGLFKSLVSLGSAFTNLFKFDSSDKEEMEEASETEKKNASNEAIVNETKSSMTEDEYTETVKKALELFQADNPMLDGETQDDYQTRINRLWENTAVRNSYIAKLQYDTGALKKRIEDSYKTKIDNIKSYVEPYVEYELDEKGERKLDENGQPIIKGGFKKYIESEEYTSALQKSKDIAAAFADKLASAASGSSSGGGGGSGIFSSDEGVNLYNFGSPEYTDIKLNDTLDGSSKSRHSPLHEFFAKSQSNYADGGYAWSFNGNFFKLRSTPKETGEGTTDAEHMGADINWSDGSDGKEARATCDGEVITSMFSTSGGNMVEWKDAAGYVHTYMHMKEHSKVNTGDKIKAGDLLGYVGNTGESAGAHLHYGISTPSSYNGWSNGAIVNPFTYFGNYNPNGGGQDEIGMTGNLETGNAWNAYKDKPGVENFIKIAKEGGMTPAQIATIISTGIWEDGGEKIFGTKSLTATTYDYNGQRAEGIMNWVSSENFGSTVGEQLDFIKRTYFDGDSSDWRAVMRHTGYDDQDFTGFKVATGRTDWGMDYDEHYGPVMESDLISGSEQFYRCALVPECIHYTDGTGVANYVGTAAGVYNWMLDEGLATGGGGTATSSGSKSSSSSSSSSSSGSSSSSSSSGSGWTTSNTTKQFTGVVRTNDGTGVNMRVAGGLNAQIITVIPDETELNTYGQGANGGKVWHKVRYNGKYGYVCGDYFILGATPVITPQNTGLMTRKYYKPRRYQLRKSDGVVNTYAEITPANFYGKYYEGDVSGNTVKLYQSEDNSKTMNGKSYSLTTVDSKAKQNKGAYIDIEATKTRTDNGINGTTPESKAVVVGGSVMYTRGSGDAYDDIPTIESSVEIPPLSDYSFIDEMTNGIVPQTQRIINNYNVQSGVGVSGNNNDIERILNHEFQVRSTVIESLLTKILNKIETKKNNGQQQTYTNDSSYDDYIPEQISILSRG